MCSQGSETCGTHPSQAYAGGLATTKHLAPSLPSNAYPVFTIMGETLNRHD